ncbi:ABC transporter ATP-binding protein [Propionibacteriaceae bacterium Y1923]|uniref:ABC transporter ATP-binding protein n=1 Tax=Aestuariimicrobium sp. Y1814 TaxID=3418742 RepID=UPI003C14E5DD
MSSVVELAGVDVVRGGAKLLDDITWQVAEGERWVVIGPNGAGKTTLMQVLAAQLHPTSGLVGLLDELLGAVDVFELRPRIGVSSAAIQDRIPRGERVDDVVMSASYAVMGRWREDYDPMDVERAQGLLRQLRVDHLAARTFGTLSEGERKRVQIARALMTDPELLLLDEPGAGLDLTGRESLVSTLSEICLDEEAPATVLVTHHIEEIPEGITHALLLRQGRVVASGPISEVLTDENLSATFDLPLKVGHEDGRWTARAVRNSAPARADVPQVGVAAVGENGVAAPMTTDGLRVPQ